MCLLIFCYFSKVQLLDLDCKLADIDGVLLRDVEFLYRAGALGVVRHLGLHYLEDEERVTGCDAVSFLDQHLPHVTGRLRHYLFRHVRLSLLGFDRGFGAHIVERDPERLCFLNAYAFEAEEFVGLDLA